MAKARKISKRRRPKKRPLPAKAKSSARSWRKRILLAVGIAIVVIIPVGIYLFHDKSDRTGNVSPAPPVESREPLIEEADLTPEEETVALKKEEMEFAQAVLADFPDTVEALEMMANLHSRHGRRDEALPLWEKCLAKDPNLLSVHRNLGSAAVDEGRFESAIERFTKAIEIAPEATGLHEEIGFALIEMGRYDEAIEELQKELRLFPQAVKAHFLMGQAYTELKQYTEARQHYETAIGLSPEYSSAYYGLARVCTALKEHEQARLYEDKFRILRGRRQETLRSSRMSTYSEDTDLRAIRSSVVTTLLDAHKLYLAGRDIGRAEEILKRALVIDPNSVQSMERLAVLYNATNRLEPALRQFERISMIDPSNSYNYLNMASVFTKLGRHSDAENAYRKAIESAPELSTGYRTLAQLYLTRGVMPGEALKLAQKAASIEASARNLFVLAWASDVNGNRPEALEAIEEALRLEPENARYRQVYERIKSGN